MFVVFWTGRTAARLSSGVPPLHLPQCARTRLFEKFRNLPFAPTKPVAEMERLLLSTRRASQRAATVHFRVGSGCRTGSSGRFGNGGLEGRGFLDGSCSRPDMRLLSERSATSANDRDFTSGYCQKGNRSRRVCRPDRQTRAALATKRLIAKTLHDSAGEENPRRHGSLRLKIGEDDDSSPGER